MYEINSINHIFGESLISWLVHGLAVFFVRYGHDLL